MRGVQLCWSTAVARLPQSDACLREGQTMACARIPTKFGQVEQKPERRSEAAPEAQFAKLGRRRPSAYLLSTKPEFWLLAHIQSTLDPSLCA
jgi:hypothetical protein